MSRAACLLAFLVPSLALAQVTVTETSNFPQGSDQVINNAECKGDVQSTFAFTWRLTTSTTTSGDLRISDTSTCVFPSNNVNTTAVTKSIGAFTTATGTTPSRSANTIAPLLGLGCADGTLRTLFFCAVTTLAGVETPVSGSFQLDGTTPTPPVLNGATPGDTALDVSWQAASNANRYRVTATSQADATDVHTSGEVTGTSLRISGLTNGTTYNVVVFGISIGGNVSAASNTVAATAIEVEDFWRLYRDAGGRDQGGCSTGGAGALALLGLVPFVVRRKRS